MKKSELRQIIKEEISKVSETYASSFGGYDKVNWEEVENELNRLGYDTPFNGIFDQIPVMKDGVRVGKIDMSAKHYFHYPNGIYNNTPYRWSGLDGFLKQID